MCESKLFVRENGDERLVSDDIVSLVLTEEGYYKAYRMDGKVFELKGYVLDHIDFLKHKIVFRRC